MKELIKQLLREGLDEMSTRPKEIFGKGVEHDIYASEKFSNMLFKVGNAPVVKKWAEIFQSNSELFPKVYRLGELKNGKMYAAIEKLNTNQAVKEWQEMELAFEQVGLVDTDVFDDTIDQLFINILSGYVSEKGVYDKLSFNKSVQQLYKKWIIFLSKTLKYVKKFGYNGIDLHRYNFAYDSAGNIKAIDI